MSRYETRLMIAAKMLAGMIASAPICDRTKINKRKWSQAALQWADALIAEAEKKNQEKTMNHPEHSPCAELLPCPFCGGEPLVERAGTRRYSTIIRCTECGAFHESCDQDSRVGASWNRRTHASPPASAGLIAEQLKHVAWNIRARIPTGETEAKICEKASAILSASTAQRDLEIAERVMDAIRNVLAEKEDVIAHGVTVLSLFAAIDAINLPALLAEMEKGEG